MNHNYQKSKSLFVAIGIISLLSAISFVLFTIQAQAHIQLSIWTTIDMPGAMETFPSGISGNNIIGSYSDMFGRRGNFLYNGTTWTTLDMPGATYTGLSGISGNNIIGSYQNTSDYPLTHGFLYNGTTWTTLDMPGAIDTIPIGIDGNNIIGYYQNVSGFHSFLYNGTTWTTLDIPGAIRTKPFGISGNNIVGTYENISGEYGFLYNGITWITLDMPGVTYNYKTTLGISGNDIVGSSWGYSEFGFLYNGMTLTRLDMQGMPYTVPLDIDGNNIVGYYYDIFGGRHGFFHTMLSNHIEIDIKPGSDSNCFNNDGRGVIPVAILSTDVFDATTINLTTVYLDGQAVRVVGKGKIQASQEDVNKDGRMDLVVQIEDTDGIYTQGTTIATLMAETVDGVSVHGIDNICITQ